MKKVILVFFCHLYYVAGIWLPPGCAARYRHSINWVPGCQTIGELHSGDMGTCGVVDKVSYVQGPA